jgi:Ser/Thr protein kinase RdoA (MazF antagonist)
MDIHKGDYLKKAEQIGKNTALLCRALDSCAYENGIEYDMIKYVNGEYEWCKEQANRATERISKEILDYINDFHSLYKKLPRQIIHKDLNPNNIMFDDTEFRGFVEKAITESTP